MRSAATAWGVMEWKGAFGAGSVEWTANLRRQLDHTDTNDGTFWMSWHDVLSRFSGLDICKTHEVCVRLLFRCRRIPALFVYSQAKAPPGFGLWLVRGCAGFHGY